MKKSLLTIALLGFFIFGCAENSSIVGPDYQVSESSGKTWIQLPSNLKLFKTETFSELINGRIGGKISFRVDFGDIKVNGTLKIKKNSFEGEEEISVLIDDRSTTTTFTPSPFEFNKPLIYSVKYKGLDLQGFNPDDFDFYYTSPNGEMIKAEYSSLNVDIDKGILEVKKAKLPHFSRYGFAR